MKICLLDVCLVGAVLLIACLLRKTEGMKGTPISPKYEKYRPLKFREMLHALKDNSTIGDVYSEMTQLEYSPYVSYTTHDITAPTSNKPQRTYLQVSQGINAVEKHDVSNLPSSGETARASESNLGSSRPIALFRVISAPLPSDSHVFG